MNILNKNVGRTIGILLLLTLFYMGLCFEVAALYSQSPTDVIKVGELYELDGGYSIEVVIADVESGEAKFALYKEGKTIDGTVVNSGQWFYFNDGEIFYFEAKLDSVFRSNDAIKVEWTDYNWVWEKPRLYVMAVGELLELDEGYSIKVVEADVESGEAKFALYKEGKTIDETFVSIGERFYLDDVEIFYFQATLESVSGSKDAIKVELTDFNLDWGETFLDVMAVGEPLELDEVYSILVEEANIKEKKAQFVLYKEERGIDFITVSDGEFFILSDGENFYFSATLDSVFRSEDSIKVGLTGKDYDYDVYKYSPFGDYLILALIVFLSSSLSFFFYQRYKKKKLLEKEYQSKMEDKKIKNVDVDIKVKPHMDVTQKIESEKQKIKFAKRKEIIELNSQEKVKHKDHSKINSLYEGALELEKRGEYNSSIETYEKIIDTYEYYKKAWEGLERIYKSLGESEKRNFALEQIRIITEIINFETNAVQKINLQQFDLQNLDFFDNLIWTFQPQINILLGKNGYGKTYLLRLLISLLQKDDNISS